MTTVLLLRDADAAKAAFMASRDQLTERLALVFENRLKDMGEDIRSLSWFSSTAENSNALARVA